VTVAPTVHFRQAGQGPGVVCLHSNAASASQWRALMDRLAPRYTVVAPDSYGAGKSPAWPEGGATLRGEVALLEPAFQAAGDSFVLVGHSYGAAIALVAAALRPERVRALALYEPTLFSLVDHQQPPPNGADGIKAAVMRSIAALGAGDEDGAAREFIDFWMGAGAWAAMPPARKPAITTAVRDVEGWARALVGEPMRLEDFGAALQMPVLLMTGQHSPASGHAPARVLQPVLRQCQTVEFRGLGHMGPLTHPEPVNAAIEAFLDRL
jgi:pimeloyl-ACP methyl ester carboxylesterase